MTRLNTIQPAATVGILMLDSRFPRILGDIGNAQSWPFPVDYHIVKGATPERIIKNNPHEMLAPFIEGAEALIANGARGITTTCGFLSLFQADLANALSVPVVTSSLMQTRLINQILGPSKQAGILTICQSALTPAHLAAADVPSDTPIATTEGLREFSRAVLGNEPKLDITLAKQDNIDAARQLASQPNVGAIILECTNMAPYAADISAATGLPVFSAYNFICWFQSGLMPAPFTGEIK